MATDVEVDVEMGSAGSQAATAGEDFEAFTSTFIIPAGQASISVDVAYFGDTDSEADETFFLRITEARGAEVRPELGDYFKVVEILNDDPVDGIDAGQVVNGSANANMLFGLNGPDIIRGRGGDDTIEGGNGFDTVFGGVGADEIDGGIGDDSILRQGNNDTIDGGEGVDVISGGSGNDSITGGAGDDVLRGNGNSEILRLAWFNIWYNVP